MTGASSGRSHGGATRSISAALRAADGLAFAASPTFAVMALLTAAQGGGAADMLCAAGADASPLNGIASGMTLMYALMSAFHSAPWVRLISRRKDRRTTG